MNKSSQKNLNYYLREDRLLPQKKYSVHDANGTHNVDQMLEELVGV